jgi:YD repeat-containing protein
VNTALIQTFTYSTTWSTVNGNLDLWTSKQTIVTSQDQLRAGIVSSVNTYGYGPSSSGEPFPLFIPEAPPPDPNVPVEETVTYQDGGGTTLETKTKSWYNAQQPQSEQISMNGGPNSQTTYTYGAGGEVTEKDEYDFGATSATRKTVTNYQGFGTTPIFTIGPSIFDRPCQTIVYNGSGARYSETDYYYDNGATTTPCGTAGTPSVTSAGGSSLTGHDITNYEVGSSSPRGNLTQKTKWLNTGGSPVITYSYDETGQVVSITDPCGNATCSDMVPPTPASTTYSYADNFVSTNSGTFTNTAGSPPSSYRTNAYLTKITAPPTNSFSHIKTYAYGYNDGQLTESFDQNNQPTTYKFNDKFDRLTEIDFPDLGQTAYSYNDAPPISTTTTSLVSSSPSTVQKQSTVIFDGMGNTRKTELLTDPDGETYTRIAYDGLGKKYQSWNPTRCDPDANPTSCSGETTYGITTDTYDALGRIKTVGQQDGSTVSTS